MYIDAHLSLKHVQMYSVLVFGVIGGFITGGKVEVLIAKIKCGIVYVGASLLMDWCTKSASCVMNYAIVLHALYHSISLSDL